MDWNEMIEYLRDQKDKLGVPYVTFSAIADRETVSISIFDSNEDDEDE